MSLGTARTLSAQDVREVSDVKQHRLGELGQSEDGKKLFRYTKNGATALDAGVAVVTPAAVANHLNRDVAAAPAGATKVTVTVGATAVTEDQYTDGELVVNAGTGAGQSVRITGHATVGSAGGAVEVSLAEPLTVGLVAGTSKVSLIRNRQSDVIVNPGNSANLVCAGTTGQPVAENEHFWAQTGGEASVLSEGVIAKGAKAIISASDAGALVTQGANSVTQIVGYAPEATVNEEYRTVYLTIDK